MARKIAASEIDVDEILANLARIGNFTITNGSLAVDTSVSDRTQITFPANVDYREDHAVRRAVRKP